MVTRSKVTFDAIESHKVCRECRSNDIPVKATRCKHCGASLKPFYQKKIGFYVIGIIFLFAGMAVWRLWIVALICIGLGARSNR